MTPRDQPENEPLVLSLGQVGAGDLDLVGGKAANLGELAAHDFPVPPGFCITTAAYRRFMSGCSAEESIYDGLDGIRPDDLDTARTVGADTRALLNRMPMPQEVSDAVEVAWGELGASHAYAVRSSATAEDLPEASFAGQQDTFLNIVGFEPLIESVRQCWISLFTDRAILYRIRNEFAHQQVQLAVIVQRMLEPDVSGILFTADPATGRRNVASIDASFGLGEALVAGLVTADQVWVSKTSGEVVAKQIGEKSVAIRSASGGGTVRERLSLEKSRMSALNDRQAAELTALATRIEAHFERPQDIEWAIVDGEPFILQSRPITSLFPIPLESLEMADRTGELQIMVSFSAIQGMLGPMTPLGQDTIRGMFAGAAVLFGEKNYTVENQPVIWSAAERLFVNLTALIRHPIGRMLGRRALGVIEPSVAQALDQLWQDARLKPERGWLKLKTLKRVFSFLGPLPLRYARALLRPEAARQRFQQLNAELVANFQQKAKESETLASQVALLEEIVHVSFYLLLPAFIPVIGVAMGSLTLLNRIAGKIADGRDRVLAITRGMPHNVTSEMDLALWCVANAIRSDKDTLAHFGAGAAAGLAQDYLMGALPAAGQAAVSAFMNRYGMRGVGEIDIGRPRWCEDPTHIMQVLLGYLRVEDSSHAPDRMFAIGAAGAESAIDLLTQELVATRGGQVKAKLARIAAHRMRALSGLRESPKFTVIRLFGLARALLLESGRKLVSEGVLARQDDLFFLRLQELRLLAQGQELGWQECIAERKRVHRRESKRRQIPRLLLSDGHAFYAGLFSPDGAKEGTLSGSPVSPGTVEGSARVVLDPLSDQMLPGEILVCPGTDPAWTPLFLSAGGLVMEVGGLMTHGSVVAREYGIPAVVGVHQATSRIKTGTKVRVDGSTGLIVILD